MTWIKSHWAEVTRKPVNRAERELAHQYSEVRVWRILGGLRFSSQKPERRTDERDEDAMHGFKRRTWTGLKKGMFILESPRFAV